MKFSTFFTISAFLARNAATANADATMAFIVYGDKDKCANEANCDVEAKPVDLDERHKVRCCSETSKAGWKHYCAVWGESDLFANPAAALAGVKSCNSRDGNTYAEAVDICDANGARLCTKDELLDRCTRASGCKYDTEYIWSNTMVEDTHVFLACGDHGKTSGSSCGGTDTHFDVSTLTEVHEVRCCTEDAHDGWTKRDGCSVYGESELVPVGGGDPECHHMATYYEAVNICESNNARLCTKSEILARCTYGTGCAHDEDLVWTSTVADEEMVSLVQGGELGLRTTPSSEVCTTESGSVWGDPHILTFDQLRFDCQGHGEFVLVESKGDDPLQIHSRFTGDDWTGNPSVARAIAIKVHEDVDVLQISVPDGYTSDLGCPLTFTYGETETTIPTDQIIEHFQRNYAGDANAYMNHDMFIITFPDTGTRIEVRSKLSDTYDCMLRANVCVTPENHGELVGLFGNHNEDASDDWIVSSEGGGFIEVPDKATTSLPDRLQQALEYCVTNWCVPDVENSLWSGTNFDEYNKCNETDSDFTQIDDLIDQLDDDIKDLCEAADDPEACLIDSALENDPIDAANQTVLDDEAMHNATNLNETELCAGLGGFTGSCTEMTEITDLENPEATASGDPHFKTWTKEHFEYHGQCDLILVKDNSFANGLGLEVQIRTKLVRFWSYIKSAAIRIGDDILEVQGNGNPDDIDNHYWFNLEYQGEIKTIGGFPVTLKDTAEYSRSFEIDLSSKYPGLNIVINYYKEFVKVDFKNGSKEAFGNTIGLLGNFKTGKTLARDGFTVIDDFSQFGNEWQVLPFEHMLFHDVEQPQFPSKCIEPEDPRGDRRRRLGESSVSEAEAEKACASLSDPLDRKDCIYDILATQDLGMVGAY